jgi:hypothetical protein
MPNVVVECMACTATNEEVDHTSEPDREEGHCQEPALALRGGRGTKSQFDLGAGTYSLPDFGSICGDRQL